MVGLAAFGTMNAMLSTGARIAGERSVGWNRQLRITPLTTRTYFRAKVLTGYMMALTTLVVLYAAGSSLGVSLPADEWLRMTDPDPHRAAAVRGARRDARPPAHARLDRAGDGRRSTALLAMLGGTWFPITGGVMTTSRAACRRTGSSRRATSPSAARAGAAPAGSSIDRVDGRPRRSSRATATGATRSASDAV